MNIGGITVYLGVWPDPDGALAYYPGQKPTSIKIPFPAKSAKPSNPHTDYPLYDNASCQWDTQVRNKVHYFVLWADPEAALQMWLITGQY